MTPTEEGYAQAAELRDSSRLPQLDLLRGFAILCMLFISIWEFGGFSNNQQLFYRTGTHGGNFNLLTTVSVLFEGKMRALLALVFGAGIVLYVSQKTKEQDPRYPDLYIRRMIWLGVFGLINAFVMLWHGDILFNYACTGILLFPFWRMKPRGLLIASLVLTLIYCGKIYWAYAEDQASYRKYLAIQRVEKSFAGADSVKKKTIDSLLQVEKKDPLSGLLSGDTLLRRHRRDTLTSKQQSDKQAWENLLKGSKYDSTADKSEQKTLQADSYTEIWSYQAERSQRRESFWFYRIGIWDIGSMVFLGMALFGFGFFGSGWPARHYLLPALIGIAGAFALGWLRNYLLVEKGLDYAKYLDHHLIGPTQFFPIERFCAAVGYAALLMWLHRISWLRYCRQAVEAVGRMALSNYLLQCILGTVIFFGYGMGYFGHLTQWQLYLVVAEMILLQVLFSVLWLRFFYIGPAEWLLRSLVLRKKQPLVRPASGETVNNIVH